MTQDQIKSKLPPPLTGPRLVPDQVGECDHIVLICFPDEMGYIAAKPEDVKCLMGDHGKPGPYCSKCGARLEVPE